MAAFDGHKNFAYSTVATAPSPATSGTTLVVATGTGANFPSAAFNAVVWPANSQPTAANAEIVRVTAGFGTDTWTITRTQESSNSRSITAGDQIMAAVTAKTLTDLEAGFVSSVSFLAAGPSIQRITVTDANVTTASKILLGAVRKADVTNAADYGFYYIANIVTVANGSFDVVIIAYDLDGPVLYSVPAETITLNYKVYN